MEEIEEEFKDISSGRFVETSRMGQNNKTFLIGIALFLFFGTGGSVIKLFALFPL